MKYKKPVSPIKIAILLIVLIGSAIAVTAATAQTVNPDSVQAFVDRDKNCSDFVDRQSAQTHFEALDIILSQGREDLDPHNLDRDGNGYACEGKEYMRWIKMSADTSNLNLQIRTVETVHSVKCDPIPPGWINITEYSNKMTNAPFTQIEYMPSMAQAECLDTLFEVYSYNP